eukprot:1157328-Pelagomonas_calceolata.AAC.21
MPEHNSTRWQQQLLLIQLDVCPTLYGISISSTVRLDKDFAVSERAEKEKKSLRRPGAACTKERSLN